jgi:hypothetical protein
MVTVLFHQRNIQQSFRRVAAWLSFCTEQFLKKSPLLHATAIALSPFCPWFAIYFLDIVAIAASFYLFLLFIGWPA